MIYWVFGGTAVGKKRFIAQALDPKTRPTFLVTRTCRAAGLPDGPLLDDLVTLDRQNDVLVRWQWGRDEVVQSIATVHPGTRQAIIHLSAGLMTQMSRVALREGCLKWDADNLVGEARDIYELVHALSSRHRLPVLYVASDAAYTLRTKINP